MENQRHLTRKIRILRLLAVVRAYHHYSMMEMHRQVLQHDNTWEEAEQLSDFMSVIAPHMEHSPTDFLHDKDETSDIVLTNYEDFKKWQKIAEGVDISEKTLLAFCKNVDNLQSVFGLKALGHIFYSEWLMALFLYVNDSISKTDLQKIFVEYSLFTGKLEPPNLTLFGKTMFEIEEKILEIANKQTNRSIEKN